jgi:putative membrane protein
VEVNMQIGMMDGYGMGYGIIGILWLIFWILIIVGLVLLIKYLWEGGRSRKEQESGLEILKKRYARGEISKEEFEEKKKDLI